MKYIGSGFSLQLSTISDITTLQSRLISSDPTTKMVAEELATNVISSKERALLVIENNKICTIIEKSSITESQIQSIKKVLLLISQASPFQLVNVGGIESKSGYGFSIINSCGWELNLKEDTDTVVIEAIRPPNGYS